MVSADASVSTEMTVQSPAGTFKGLPDDGAIHFLGIRYASSERFGAPIPYKYPDGTHEMTTASPMAIQISSELNVLLTGVDVDKVPQEESCQYLSITVPEGSREKLPVMVWIHGGSFVAGGCDMPCSDRRPLVTECNVIVVGLGYRLGVLGFLKDRNGNLSNNGLLDLIEGLRWVKENISSFGGDPDNITLFGESAGGEAARCIMLSDGTEGLYRRAIMQSPPIGFMTGRTAMEARMLEELNRMPIDADIDEVKKVQTSIESHVKERGPAKYMPFGPTYGIFPLPEESGISDRVKSIASDHDILIGSTEREVSPFISLMKTIVALDKFILTRWLVEAIIKSKSRSLFRKPIETFAGQYAECGGKVYLYRFDWMKDYNYLGAGHTTDLQLIFGAKGLEGKDIVMGKKESETLEEGKPMRKMWTEFARSGEVEETELKGILTIRRIENRRADDVGIGRMRHAPKLRALSEQKDSVGGRRPLQDLRPFRLHWFLAGRVRNAPLRRGGPPLLHDDIGS